MTTEELISSIEEPGKSWNDIVEELNAVPFHYVQEVAKVYRITISNGDDSCLPGAIASYIKC